MCNRWYYRCLDCLSVAASNERLPRGSKCGACGGCVSEMGQVSGCRITRTEMQCACDARCTGASGPSCDCSCKGENHGTGRVVPVVRDLGPVPVLAIVPTDKAIGHAAEFRAAIDPLRAERDAIRNRTGGGWIPGAEYNRLCELEYIIGRARKSLTHSTRMKILAAIAVSA